MNRGDRGHPYPGSFLCPDTGEEPPFELVLLKNTNPRKFGMGALTSGAAAAVGARSGVRDGLGVSGGAIPQAPA